MLLFLQLCFFCPAYGKKQNEFKFYNIGSVDKLTTAIEKLNSNGFSCVQGKAFFLNIKSFQEHGKNRKTPDKIEEVMTIDKTYEKMGKGLSYDEMPIEVIDCIPPADSSFVYTTFYFSKFNQKILTIKIGIEKINILREKLIRKFGSCISDGYCESEESILFLIHEGDWHLHSYFFKNIKQHDEKLKKFIELKTKKLEESIDKAF
jgi:hypothetical protein